jgi:hypothetical protein
MPGFEFFSYACTDIAHFLHLEVMRPTLLVILFFTFIYCTYFIPANDMAYFFKSLCESLKKKKLKKKLKQVALALLYVKCIRIKSNTTRHGIGFSPVYLNWIIHKN